jgi:hypothetical protein
MLRDAILTGVVLYGIACLISCTSLFALTVQTSQCFPFKTEAGCFLGQEIEFVEWTELRWPVTKLRQCFIFLNTERLLGDKSVRDVPFFARNTCHLVTEVGNTTWRDVYLQTRWYPQWERVAPRERHRGVQSAGALGSWPAELRVQRNVGRLGRAALKIGLQSQENNSKNVTIIRELPVCIYRNQP